MTFAVCIKCGATKFGALTNCHHCGQDAKNAKDLALGILLSDHYFPIEELKEIGSEIARTGSLPIFAERQQSEMVATIENSPYLEMLLNPLSQKCDEQNISDDRKIAVSFFAKIDRIILRLLRSLW